MCDLELTHLNHLFISPLPRGSPLKYGEPSAFGEDMLSAIDSNGNVMASSYSRYNRFSHSQPSTSHNSSSTRPLFPSLDSSRKKPVSTDVDDEDDWFSRRWKGSDERSESRRDAHEGKRPRHWEPSTSSSKQTSRSNNYRSDQRDTESSRFRNNNGDLRRRIDYNDEERDRKERLRPSYSHQSQRNHSRSSKSRKKFREDQLNTIVLRNREVERRDVDNSEQRYNGGYF
jgi:hypothetical protein